jgi:ribonucleoside-triphosphate reductase
MPHKNEHFPVIRKRDGRLVKFDQAKITQAIQRSFFATGVDDPKLAEKLSGKVLADMEAALVGTVPQVEEIQDIVERILIKEDHVETAKAFILYRAKRTSIRDGRSELMDTVEEILRETPREYKYVFNSPSAKMLKIASAASQSFYLSRLIPAHYSEAHRRGDFHIHDLDYYGKTVHSMQIPLLKLMEKGFCAGYGFLRPPKRMATAAAQAAIILQGCQNDMTGGQCFPSFERDLALFSEKHFKESDESVFQAMEGLIYNLNSMYSRVGAQVPFSSINLGTDTSAWGRKITKAILTAMQKGLGRGETPLFPQVIFRLKDGINLKEKDPNHDLFQLALTVASHRMNPTFSFMDAPINADAPAEASYFGSGARICENRNGDASGSGRGELALVTINLPRAALKVVHKRKSYLLSSFMNELERIVSLAGQQLMHRFEILSHLKAQELPFLMGEKIYMGSDHLEPESDIASAIKNGILSIGFSGLAETLILLTGKHHGEDEKARSLGLEIVGALKQAVLKSADKYAANIILSAAAAENAGGRFPLLDRHEFGVIPRVTDKIYYHGSFHVPGNHPISIGEKLAIEGAYHCLCPGGHFSFVELAGPGEDTGRLEKIIKTMKKSGIGYGGFSFPLEECLQCGSSDIRDRKCTSCGSSRNHALRRATAFLAPLDYFNDAMKESILQRIPQAS